MRQASQFVHLVRGKTEIDPQDSIFGTTRMTTTNRQQNVLVDIVI
jgi:hypothetical protein